MLIKKYTSTWIKNFDALKGEVDKWLQGLVYTIEHIGSTAVPDLDAKPIIDMDIIYFNKEGFGNIKKALEKAGYYHNGNQDIEDREVFKRNNNPANDVLDAIPHHLYVCPANSKALQRHILTRDFLRKHEWARMHYQQIKYELAEKANQNKKVYAALKECNVNDFIDRIIEEEKQTNTGSYAAPPPL
jgi:GrpB-like predicted nucleotidyltransferase (UPF0157 family)